MRLIEAAANAYLAGGLSLLPINHKSKMPAWWLLPQKRTRLGELVFRKQAVDDGGNLLFYPNGKPMMKDTTDNTGIPARSWDDYAERQPTADELRRWLCDGIRAMAVVTGAVSGGAEILDFDARNGETWFKQWCALAGEPIERYGLPLQKTGGGGYQVGWRSDVVESSQKLARVPDETEAAGWKAMIETRGGKAYALITPSVHPSGNGYELLHGRFSQMPRIDPELRSFFLDCARKLNQVEVKDRKSSGNTQYASSGSNEVADAFNKAHPIEEMLRKYGYTDHGNRWSRPNKPDSMGLVVFNDGKAYAFSSNDRLNSDRCAADKKQPFSSFDLFAYYEHNEDYSAATKAAAIELGLHTELHTLIYVEGYDNAAVTRETMFKQGWVARGFRPDKINLDGINRYNNIVVWAYTDSLAKHVAGMIPGAYPLVVPKGLDAQAMAKDGILQPYLEAVLADANSNVEVMTW